MGNSVQNISTFDTRTSWKNISNTVITSRSHNNKYFSKLLLDENTICTPNNSSKIKVKNRIGSDSVYAYVYKISTKIGNKVIFAAAKIIPDIPNSNTDIDNEIKIAKILSDTVINKESKYFPIVYRVIKCKNTIYPNLTIHNKPKIKELSLIHI